MNGEIKKMDKQQERQEWVEMLQALNKLRIEGQDNIFIMYNLIGFVQKKIIDIDKENQIQGG